MYVWEGACMCEGTCMSVRVCGCVHVLTRYFCDLYADDAFPVERLRNHTIDVTTLSAIAKELC